MNNQNIQITDLVTVESPLVITEKLAVLGEYVAVRCAEIGRLVATEDTVKAVKKTRAELNKEFEFCENWRKEFKESCLKAYRIFEESYNLFIANPYKMAETNLKDKIADVENAVKQEKYDTIEAYYNEYAVGLLIKTKDFPFAGIGIKIGLSSSITALKKQAREYLDKIDSDIKMMQWRPYASEYLVEYVKCKDAGRAMEIVDKRHAEIRRREEEKISREQASQAVEDHSQQIQMMLPQEESAPFDEPEEAVLAPQISDEPRYNMTFTVKGTKTELRAIKEFIVNNGVEIIG